MAPPFCSLKDINPSRTQWALKLRLVRRYQVPAFGNPQRIQSTECVFHDKEGHRIHASIRSNLLGRLNATLAEGSVFAVKNFVVTNNRLRFKTTSNPYMLIFINDTKVVEIFDASFPSQMFDFKPIHEICNVQQLKENEMFDVIGRIVTINPPQMRNRDGRETRWMEVVLEDPERNYLTCTLWDEYVDKMMERVQMGGEAPIVVLQFCRGKVYMDRVTVSTTYNATKLIIDGDLGEVAEFKTRFVEQIGGHPATSTRSLSSMGMRNVDMLNSSVEVHTIQQLRTSEEVGSFWVKARIVAIETIGQWWYLSCPQCFRKISKAQQRFYCTSCDRFDTTGTPRYKIQVLVQDATDNASLLLWDQNCIELIGKTAMELREETKQVEDADLLPEEINILLGQEIFFKVQVTPEQLSNYYGPYSVKKISTDMSRFTTSVTTSQGSDEMSKMQGGEAQSDKVGSLEGEDKTPLGSSSNEKGKAIVEDMSVKRKLIDEFSTNAPEKKKVFIKQENE